MIQTQARAARPGWEDEVRAGLAYRELQTAGTAQHVTMFTRCSFPA